MKLKHPSSFQELQEYDIFLMTVLLREPRCYRGSTCLLNALWSRLKTGVDFLQDTKRLLSRPSNHPAVRFEIILFGFPENIITLLHTHRHTHTHL